MLTLKASNKNLTAGAKYSYLNSNYASGVTSVIVLNSDGFASDDYVLLGEWGSETSEIMKVTGVTAATHTISFAAETTKFSHPESTKITIIKYNQVKFYQTASTTFSDSENYLGAIDVQADSLFTIYQDSVNSTGYGWFKFYNETSLKITAESNYIPYGDFASNSAKKIIEGFLRSLNQKDSKLISLSDAFEWLSEGYSIAQTELNLINKEYKATISSDQTTTSGVSEYAFPDNASEMLSVWDDTNNLEIKECPLEDVDKYNSSLISSATKYYVRGNYIGFTPKPTSAVTYKLTFISKPAAITSLTDLIDLPDNKFYILKDFLRFRAAEPLGKQNGQMYYELFMKSIEDMKTAAINRGGGRKSMGIDPYANI
ncbi:MAG: hypothetical protein KAQ85_01095 [Thermodesulfovibrionia bacterium]|nr:hypothetical protein [Thermodesulfovibrionia bacterium]